MINQSFHIRNLLHHDAVNFYSILSQYRTPEYAKVNSGWIYLDSTEQLFKHAKSRVFNSKQGTFQLCFIQIYR